MAYNRRPGFGLLSGVTGLGKGFDAFMKDGFGNWVGILPTVEMMAAFYTTLVFNQTTGVIWAAYREEYFLVMKISPTIRGVALSDLFYQVSRLLGPFRLVHIVISSHAPVNFPSSPLDLLTIPFLITPIKFRKRDVECLPPL